MLSNGVLKEGSGHLQGLDSFRLIGVSPSMHYERSLVHLVGKEHVVEFLRLTVISTAIGMFPFIQVLYVCLDALLPVLERHLGRHCDRRLITTYRHLYLTVLLEIAALKHKVSGFFHPVLLLREPGTQHLHPGHLNQLLCLRNVGLLSVLYMINGGRGSRG